MEDHWRIFFRDPWLYFVRSWTGFCIYKLRLEKNEQGHRIKVVFANRDSRQYGGDCYARRGGALVHFDRPPSIGFGTALAVKAVFVANRLAMGSAITNRAT
jgi:hypothetical protein